MGLESIVNLILINQQQITFRPAAAYGVAANTIFTIQGGPVVIQALVGRVVAAIAGVPTMTFTVSGAAVDSGATVVTCAANRFIVCPLDDAGLVAVVPNVAARNLPAIDGLFAVTGNIVVTVGAAPTVGTVEWYCVWRGLNPASSVI